MSEVRCPNPTCPDPRMGLRFVHPVTFLLMNDGTIEPDPDDPMVTRRHIFTEVIDRDDPDIWCNSCKWTGNYDNLRITEKERA